MSATAAGNGKPEERVTVTVSLSRETAERLTQFCIDCGATPDKVVERALVEYFLEGDMSH